MNLLKNDKLQVTCNSNSTCIYQSDPTYDIKTADNIFLVMN